MHFITSIKVVFLCFNTPFYLFITKTYCFAYIDRLIMFKNNPDNYNIYIIFKDNFLYLYQTLDEYKNEQIFT